MRGLAILTGLVALATILVACRDEVPTDVPEPETAPQAQAVQEVEEVDDSLCVLLDPLISRRSSVGAPVSYREVVGAIEQGATINATCAGQVLPLHHAAAHHGVPVVELLLEHGADVHAVNSAGETPLIYAVDRGGLDTNASVLEVLLNAGADINAKKEFGQTALHVAAARGKPNLMSTLLEHQPDLGVVDHGGRSPLHYAAFYVATSEPTQQLLEAGLDPNAAASDGTTPLHFAAANGGAEISRLLIEAGANPNPINRNGLSPLHHAAPAGGAALIRVLLAHGADPNLRDPDGRTALHIAARQNPLSAVSELLLDAGADVSAKDRHGSTACDLLNSYLSDPDVRDRICDLN